VQPISIASAPCRSAAVKAMGRYYGHVRNWCIKRRAASVLIAGFRQPYSRTHLWAPGTNRPFSICAGT
jgi:hypothetical protein